MKLCSRKFAEIPKAFSIAMAFGLSSLLMQSNINAQWVQTGLKTGQVFAISAMGTNIFAADNDGVSLTTNNGTTWEPASTGLPTTSLVTSLGVIGTNVFAGLEDGDVYLSTDSGTSWSVANNGLSTGGVLAMAEIGTNLFAGTDGPGVYLSNNNGKNWTMVNNGLDNKTDIYALAVSGTSLYAGTEGGGIFRTTDNGSNWTAGNLNVPNTSVIALVVSDTSASSPMIFAGSGSAAVYQSTDNGVNWKATHPVVATNFNVDALAASGSKLFAGLYGGGVYLSTDNGSSWSAENAGFINLGILCFAIIGNNIFAGNGAGVWTQSLSSFDAVNDDVNTINSISSYPNPISASATLLYSIANESTVSITIYDALGRVVESPVVHEVENAGHHETTFDTQALPPGFYTCCLSAGDADMFAKMVMVR